MNFLNEFNFFVQTNFLDYSNNKKKYFVYFEFNKLILQINCKLGVKI